MAREWCENYTQVGFRGVCVCVCVCVCVALPAWIIDSVHRHSKPYSSSWSFSSSRFWERYFFHCAVRECEREEGAGRGVTVVHGVRGRHQRWAARGDREGIRGGCQQREGHYLLIAAPRDSTLSMSSRAMFL
jgi:hypothetical protein